MSYTVLARKYRPQNFSDVIGQDHVTRTLKNALAQGRIAHGYIFSGHRGIGKTTIARILAMALNCRSTDQAVAEPCGVCDSCVEIRENRAVDVIEIDAATNRGIDEIRELREAARYRPARDRYKIYILDEAHQITDAAFNALLKTLEEPPSHIVFMMATTQAEDIPQTIRSRCQHFSFHAVNFEDIVQQLRSIAEREQIQADDDALAMLAEAGDGSMRDALSIMDQAIACCGQHLTAEALRLLIGSVPSEVLEEMMGAVQQNSSAEMLRLVDKLITEGQSPAHFARQMIRFLRNAIVAKVAGAESPLLQISSDERARVGRVAAWFSEEDITRFLQIILRTHSELGYKQEQRFLLELGLLKLVHAQRLLPLEELLSGAEPPAATRPAPGGGSSRSLPPPSSAPRLQPAVAPRAPSSPFAADLARKNTPRSEAAPSPGADTSAAAAAPAIDTKANAGPLTEAELSSQVIAAAEAANHFDLANMIRNGEWKLNGSELQVQVVDPPVLVQMAFKKEAEQVLNTAASNAVGRPVRIKIVGNAKVTGRAQAPSPGGNAANRGRVAEEPIIRKIQEKFGAEIRSVIDYREKN
jgi:DNA polymerase-3 subunit gamma/tau